MSCCGSQFGTSQAGVTSDLMSKGFSDAFLIKGAMFTYFRFKYARYTNFALEPVSQTFQGQTAFGGNSQITLNRNGDLVYFMYIVITLPAIYAVRAKCRRSSNRRHFTSASGCCGVANEAQFPSAYPQTGRGADGCFYGNGAAVCGVAQDASCGSSSNSSSTNVGGRHGYSVPYEDPDRVWVHWSNAIGQLVIRQVDISLGGVPVDTLYADFLYIWEEVAGKPGKRLTEMIGKSRSRMQLIREAQTDQVLYVPLSPLWFMQTPGNSIPLATIAQYGVQLFVQWERLKHCVQVSHDDVVVRKCANDEKLQANDLVAWVETWFVHLDMEERNRFSIANFDQLIVQHQRHTETSTGGTRQVSLNFNYPMIELFWYARRVAEEKSNNWFNFSAEGKDPIDNVCLRLNGNVRFGNREGRYYRLVTMYQFHTNIPQAFIYGYSFALFPEEAQPSGSCNFSRVEHVDMYFCLAESLACQPVTLTIWGRSYQVLRYDQGQVSALFSS